ncbi:SUMF1/EgtB/PvdO family nonheme iron enzyme [Gimesia fumaroli]|uniref:Serine/threonine-protein kinase pkn1 n=1 Tax=Gimesia fumaroli TaxID=2527976 RepID=A0A518IGN9_9PLAN|nr:SUMF1/EgtB/PvdO family nonheme iron enzyme [Gimesia fumaroli]QDV52258.1 Serine/threonine-protein kinase pkn1 [Gimesia fumaroli]
MTAPALSLSEIEIRVCDITSEVLGMPRAEISPDSRLLEDLKCDSLDYVELMMELEEHFNVALPSETSDPVHKSIFTRQPFRISDLAELVYVYLKRNLPRSSQHFRQPQTNAQAAKLIPFSQLDGIWKKSSRFVSGLFEKLETTESVTLYRRQTDGMRCLQLPAAEVEIGSDLTEAVADERPLHIVELDSFLVDAEPVSTTAYCRFLNSVGEVPDQFLTDWFMLNTDDDRDIHMLIHRNQSEWRPLPGCETWPMILVSWYGANAYSLWANDRLWTSYLDDSDETPGSCLPTEAQWEYAARGSKSCPFPWGEAKPEPVRLRAGLHRQKVNYRAQTLPLAPVNMQLGMSPFGLHHMAGNVWQWCRDWYDADFYQTLEATHQNPLNRTTTLVRSERGGSWVGPASLCRSSYRRGRPPLARGRCLGFRCVSSVKDLS